MTAGAPRFYNGTDHRQCSAVDDQGLDCAAPEGHDGPHANINGEWYEHADHIRPVRHVEHRFGVARSAARTTRTTTYGDRHDHPS